MEYSHQISQHGVRGPSVNALRNRLRKFGIHRIAQLNFSLLLDWQSVQEHQIARIRRSPVRLYGFLPLGTSYG